MAKRQVQVLSIQNNPPQNYASRKRRRRGIGCLISLLLVALLWLVGDYIWSDWSALSLDWKAIWSGIIIGAVQIALALPDPLVALFRRFPRLSSPLSVGWPMCIEILRWLRDLILNPEAEIWGVPLSMRTDFYTGHGDFLKQMHDEITNMRKETGRAVLAITGLKGTGKAQEAYAYAAEQRQTYRWIMWINVSSKDKLENSCRSIIERWKGGDWAKAQPDDESKKNNPVEIVRTWLLLNRRPKPGDQGLLILIDYHANLPQEIRQIVEKFIEACEKNYVLLTTDMNGGSLQPFIRTLDLLSWTPKEANSFLLRRSDTVDPAQEGAAGEIVEELSSLPLALEYAGAYIRSVEGGCTLQEYLERYRAQKDEILLWPRFSYLRNSKNDTSKNETSLKNDASLATTWTASFEQIQRENGAAAELLHLCAYFAPDVIPAEIIRDAPNLALAMQRMSDTDFHEAIENLSRYSLIKYNSETKLLSVHGMVQTVIREGVYRDKVSVAPSRPLITPSGLKEKAMERIILGMYSALKKRRNYPQQAMRFLHFYLPHIRVCVRTLEDYRLKPQIDRQRIRRKEALELLIIAIDYLQEFAHYQEAEKLLDLAGEIQQELVDQNLLHQDSPEIADYLRCLADWLRTWGYYTRAEVKYAQSLAIYQRLNNQSLVPQIVNLLNNEGTLYVHWAYIDEEQAREARFKQKYQEAFARSQSYYLQLRKQLQPHAESRSEEEQGACIYSLSIASNLAWSYYKQQEHEKAQELLEILFKDFVQSHLSERVSLSLKPEKRASPQDFWRIYEQIFTIIFEVIKSILTEKYANTHRYEAESHIQLAILYTIQGQKDAAQVHFACAAECDTYYYGSAAYHPNVILRLYNQAILYRQRKKTAQKALNCLLSAWTLCQPTLASEYRHHLHIYFVGRNLAALFAEMGIKDPERKRQVKECMEQIENAKTQFSQRSTKR